MGKKDSDIFKKGIPDRPVLPETLELIARQVVEGFIIGLHKSPFHGFSVEFAEHRVYNPGDPLRHIDWRVYGRTDKLFVKKFEEETNLRCCLALDMSSSMDFRSDEKEPSKKEYAIWIASCLLQLLKRQLDAASVVFFEDRITWFSDCRSTHSHYRMLQTELGKKLSAAESRAGTGATAAIHEIADRMHRRSLVVLFSDMMEDGEDRIALFGALQHLRYNKHEVILFHMVEGTREAAFEFENRPYEFVDMETGEKIRLQAGQIRDAYRSEMKKFMQEIENQCHKYQIDYIPVDMTVPVDQILHAFLLKRNKLL